MRYASLVITTLLALSSSASPIPAESTNRVRQFNYDTPTPDSVKATVDQAIYITRNLDSEISRIRGIISSDPLFQLHPNNYDIPTNLKNAFAKATAGIQALPTIATGGGEDLPQYIADSYLPLVEVLAESVFQNLINLERLFNTVVNNPMVTNGTVETDYGIWAVFKALNAQFQGFGCQLAKAAGPDNAAGQTLKIISEQLFYTLVDNIAQGSC
ncbi:uncharacterized protein MKK02DRAFT_40806 [Dioszegia hungarica]|uniref:Uncharacterized protein n=1 Tax=Dioszegia hungarica TaxID=4972 RepID=A0AA38LRJ6_9TREE|nr:uncharacterized protein MKK02DRAFT_40806 [Dioszegia hungarica]KAI9632503.1 hypothetical protein MKK02DRAFT_40806 [Dioszegia hungarica]